jgi:hypothetical protein
MLRKLLFLSFVLVFASLFLFFFRYEIFVETQSYFCAICQGEYDQNDYYFLDSKIFGTKSEIKNVDNIYQKYINEKHSHLWVKSNCCSQRVYLNGTRSLVNKIELVGEGPGGFESLVYNTALKQIKMNFKNGDTEKLIDKYYENIKELMKIPTEHDLKIKNQEITKNLKEFEKKQ